MSESSFSSATCPMCNKGFQSKDTLSLHLHRHLGYKKYPCGYKDCDKEFYTEIERETHCSQSKHYHSYEVRVNRYNEMIFSQIMKDIEVMSNYDMDTIIVNRGKAGIQFDKYIRDEPLDRKRNVKRTRSESGSPDRFQYGSMRERRTSNGATSNNSPRGVSSHGENSARRNRPCEARIPFMPDEDFTVMGMGTSAAENTAVSPAISLIANALRTSCEKVRCQICKKDVSGEYLLRKDHVSRMHMSADQDPDTYAELLEDKVRRAFPSMTYSDRQCQSPGCHAVVGTVASRRSHVLSRHFHELLHCPVKGCTYANSLKDVTQHMKEDHRLPRAHLSMTDIVAKDKYMIDYREYNRKVNQLVCTFFPCPVPASGQLQVPTTDLPITRIPNGVQTTAPLNMTNVPFVKTPSISQMMVELRKSKEAQTKKTSSVSKAAAAAAALDSERESSSSDDDSSSDEAADTKPVAKSPGASAKTVPPRAAPAVAANIKKVVADSSSSSDDSADSSSDDATPASKFTKAVAKKPAAAVPPKPSPNSLPVRKVVQQNKDSSSSSSDSSDDSADEATTTTPKTKTTMPNQQKPPAAVTASSSSSSSKASSPAEAVTGAGARTPAATPTSSVRTTPKSVLVPKAEPPATPAVAVNVNAVKAQPKTPSKKVIEQENDDSSDDEIVHLRTVRSKRSGSNRQQPVKDEKEEQDEPSIDIVSFPSEQSTRSSSVDDDVSVQEDVKVEQQQPVAVTPRVSTVPTRDIPLPFVETARTAASGAVTPTAATPPAASSYMARKRPADDGVHHNNGDRGYGHGGRGMSAKRVYHNSYTEGEERNNGDRRGRVDQRNNHLDSPRGRRDLSSSRARRGTFPQKQRNGARPAEGAREEWSTTAGQRDRSANSGFRSKSAVSSATTSPGAKKKATGQKKGSSALSGWCSRPHYTKPK